MKPDFEKILDLRENVFSTRQIIRKNRPLLSSAWHFHPELEICYTKKSTGKRYVGNNISCYEEGDLVMLGSNLPHGFTTTQTTEQIVLQLREDFLKNLPLNNSELYQVYKLFEKAKMGIAFGIKTKLEASKIIDSTLECSGLEKLIKFLSLLLLLSKTNDYNVLCSKEYSSTINLNHLSRMKTVFEYIENNYQKDISISDAAKVISLTDSAFYKFIRRHTKKKFTQILAEYRLNHASKKLINTQMTITEACFDSGFKNVSYFNRRFKEVFNESPNEFRRKFR